MPCCFQASPMLVYVQTCISSVVKDEEHSMCQTVLVSFLVTVFITMVTPLSGSALCLGLFVCSSNTCQAELQWNPGELGGHSYWCLHCYSSWLTSWLPVLSGYSDPWYFTLAGDLSSLRRGSLVRPFTGSACMESMLCCYWNEHQNVSIMVFLFFAFGIELSNSHQKNRTKAHHCHDSWGFSLSTVVIFRLLVVFLYLFLNILCGTLSGVCL